MYELNEFIKNNVLEELYTTDQLGLESRMKKKPSIFNQSDSEDSDNSGTPRVFLTNQTAWILIAQVHQKGGKH